MIQYDFFLTWSSTMNLKKIAFTGFLLTTLMSFISGPAVASDEKIKLYASYTTFSGSMPNAIKDPNAIVSMVVNGELVAAPVISDSTSSEYSNIYIDRKFQSKEISSATLSMMMGGRKYQCKANDMPVYVQEGEYGWGTSLLFLCERQ